MGRDPDDLLPDFFYEEPAMAKASGKEAKRERVIDVPAQPSPETAIVRQPEYLPAVRERELTAAELEQQAYTQIDFYQRLTKLIAQAVPLSEMTLFGGRQDEPPQVWFSAMACRRILSWGKYNVYMHPIETHPYDGANGPAEQYRVYGELEDPKGRRVSIMGNRSTEDEFFSRAYRAHCPKCGDNFSKSMRKCPKDGTETVEEAYTLPLKEVDRASVQQAAISNAWNKALAAVGLMPSFEDLQIGLQSAGKDIEKIRRVGFSGRRQTADSDNQEQSSLRTKVFTLLARICENDKAKMADMLEELTAFTAGDGKKVKGKRDVEKLTAKQLPYVLEKLEKLAKGKPEPATTQPAQPQQPAAAQAKGGRVPKAQIPDMQIVGDVVKVQGPSMTSKNQPFMMLVIRPKGQTEEQKLYCFDNAAMQGQKGDAVKAFDLLRSASSQFCVFAYSEDTQGANTFRRITKILQIGEHYWDDQGMPYIDRGADVRQGESAELPF